MTIIITTRIMTTSIMTVIITSVTMNRPTVSIKFTTMSLMTRKTRWPIP